MTRWLNIWILEFEFLYGILVANFCFVTPWLCGIIQPFNFTESSFPFLKNEYNHSLIVSELCEKHLTYSSINITHYFYFLSSSALGVSLRERYFIIHNRVKFGVTKLFSSDYSICATIVFWHHKENKTLIFLNASLEFFDLCRGWFLVLCTYCK